jgi:hypothetical protein
MKNLFDPTLAEDIKQRIMRLHPESERRWGNMTVAQTLAHCTSGIQMATGVINPKRASFPANVIGLVIKPLVFGDDTSLCGATHPPRRNSSRQILHSATSSASGPSSSQRSIALFLKAQLAAPGTHILSLVRSNRSSGPFSCTNTSTIIYDSSAYKQGSHSQRFHIGCAWSAHLSRPFPPRGEEQ